MFEASVSNIGLYQTWKKDEDLEVGWLIQKILVREQTENMKAGEAFHKALELAGESEHACLSANGYVFEVFCDAEIAMPQLREASLSKEYAGLLVKGRVDGIDARLVSDIKTTEQFDPDRYMDSCQWRFYLDMAEANRFDWHVFVLRDFAPKSYEVYQYHKLTQYRYVGLHQDCLKLAQEYREFAEAFLPATPVSVPVAG